MEHSDEIDSCYYRSEHAALYACGDVVSKPVLRGIILTTCQACLLGSPRINIVVKPISGSLLDSVFIVTSYYSFIFFREG